MTAPSPAPEDRRRSGRWKWGLLALSILILVCYAGFQLYYLWAYVQPTTLEEVCGLSKYHSLDDCEQIYISFTRYPVKTKHGVTYYPVETQYQVLTPEDRAFGMVMDFAREHTFRRLLGGRHHPPHKREDGWMICAAFFDGAGTIPWVAYSWEREANMVSQFGLSKHCTNELCISFESGAPGINWQSHVTRGLYDPLMEIVEAVTAEKGDWIWKKEPY